MLSARWRLLLGLPVLFGALAVGGSYLLRPSFASDVLLLPPSTNQGALGALSGALGGGAAALVGSGLGGLKDPNDQWMALLRSRAVADVIVDQFDLLKLYGVEHRFQAREALGDNTRIDVTKQGMINLRVEDHDPGRAQAIARAYVAELQSLSNALAVAAAAKRRIFFEQQLDEAGQRLAAAETALKGTGVRDDVIKASPQAAVEAVAEVQRSILTLEVQVSGMRSVYTDAAPQIAQARGRLAQLRQRLAQLQATTTVTSLVGASATAASAATALTEGYVGRYRAFKYAEAVFDGVARQLELARLEEAREGALVQVVDAPSLPEWKVKPKRGFIGVFTALAVGLLLVAGLVVRTQWSRLRATPQGARSLQLLRDNLRLRRPASAG